MRFFMVTKITALLFCCISFTPIRLLGTSNNPAINYVVALDEGGALNSKLDGFSYGEVVDAHKGALGPITYNVARALQQNIIVITPTPIARNIFTISGDPLTEERIQWWDTYVTHNLITYCPEKNCPSFKKNMWLDDSKEHLEAAIQQSLPKNSGIEKSRNFLITTLMPHVEKNYAFYLSQNHHFTIFIPLNASLVDAGFSQQSVHRVSYQDFMHATADQETTKITVGELAGIWDKNNRIAKHIFLSGHGHYDPQVYGEKPSGGKRLRYAGLVLEQYQQFLNLLASINCKSLFVFTCFSGGSSIAAMHQTSANELGKILFELQAINYPILLGATSDNALFAYNTFENTKNQIDYMHYFSCIHRYTKNGVHGDLVCAVKSLQVDRLITNTPSIRSPGANNLFRAISTDPGIKILTVTDQKIWRIDKKTKNNAMTLPSGTKNAFLYYPTIVTIPINVTENSSQSPLFIAMTQGKCLHTFKKIDASHIGLRSAIRNILGVIPPHPKAMYIQELTFATGKSQVTTFTGIALKTGFQTIKNGTAPTRVLAIKGYCRDTSDGSYYRIRTAGQEKNRLERLALVIWQDKHNELPIGKPVPLAELKKMELVEINAEEYRNGVEAIIASSLPTPETIAQSSGGHETVKMLQRAAKDILEQTIMTHYQ